MNNIIARLTVVTLSSFLSVGCGDKKPVPPNPATLPVPVNLYTAQREEALYYDQYPGTLVALQQVELRPQAEGYITAMFFKEGEAVKKGQKLYEIDRTRYQAGLGQAEAGVQVAAANLAQAQKDADRYIYLNEHEAVAKQTLDHALTTLENAKNLLKAAKQDIVKSQTSLNYSIVRAPFDGVTGISQVKVGTSVSTGQTILNTISTIDPVAVDFVINEKQIPRFAALREQKAAAGDSLFTLLLPDNSVYPYPGRITLIDRSVNAQTGSITVRLQFPNPGKMLYPGMSCKVRVRNQHAGPQLLVPGKAVVEQMGEFFVYIAKDTVIDNPADTTAKNKGVSAMHALQRKVVLGAVVADKIIVKTGIEAGDAVIADGVQKMRDGALIKIQEAPPAK
ncbi:MAG: efflux RND transporter periplasmic adaptor subunit [Taibaiella sp.]|nr:efflux RND transporter periplasmic adaptor subunit [Taibaiella sp.]